MDPSLVTLSLYEMCHILWYRLVSIVCCLLRSSTARVHDSHAYRKMDVARERISHISELGEILSSNQTGLSLFNTAVVHAIRESISGLDYSQKLRMTFLVSILPC